MKQVLTFSLATLLLLYGCDAGEVTVRKYIVENGTDHNLVLERFSASFGFIDKHEVDGEGTLYEGSDNDDNGSRLSAPSALKADSIVLYFDDNKVQIYYLEDSIRSKPQTQHNLFLDTDYEVESNTLYRFVITEDDYLNAEEL